MFSKLCIVLVLTVLSARGTVNKVDIAHLNNVKDRVFRVGTEKISCHALRNVPLLFGSLSRKEQHLTLLESIPTDEILQILAENYGLHVLFGEKLEADSYIVNFVALLSKDIGRCWNLENELDDKDGNIVDIEYTLTSRNVPLMPIKLWFGYKVAVKSNGSILIKHGGEIASFAYPKYTLFSMLSGFGSEDVFEKIKGYIRDIPVALQRDIEKTRGIP